MDALRLTDAFNPFVGLGDIDADDAALFVGDKVALAVKVAAVVAGAAGDFSSELNDEFDADALTATGLAIVAAPPPAGAAAAAVAIAMEEEEEEKEEEDVSLLLLILFGDIDIGE
jgi:hypothetical protein